MKQLKGGFIIALIISFVLMVSACADTNSTPSSGESSVDSQGDKNSKSGELKGSLDIWTHTTYVKDMAEQFMKKYPDIKVNVQVFPGDQYLTKLQNALQTNVNAPDIFDLEREILGIYVNSPFAEDLSKMGAEELLKDYVPYVTELGKDQDGVVRAISDHSSPGGFWYHREQANKYLGTDDPEKVSDMLGSWDKIIELGKKVVQETDGKVHLISGIDVVSTFEQYESEPWVKDGKFYIDPKRESTLDTMRTMRQAGVDAKFESMSASYGNAFNDGSVIAIGVPSWAEYLLDNEDNKAVGKYGIAKGPMGYYWGGTYRAIYTKSPNKELAYEFVKYITTEEWQDYNLKETGNMPGLKSVYESNKDSFKIDFTGDQNTLKMYYDISMDVVPSSPDKYSEDIQKAFVKLAREGIEDNKNNEEILDALRKQVESDYPELK